MSPNTPAATITSLDHFVLTVKSISASIAWYTQHLGMRHESFVSAATPDITRHSLIFGHQKINLHELGKVSHPLCFFIAHQSPLSLVHLSLSFEVGTFRRGFPSKWKCPLIHKLWQELEPKALNVQSGSADLCFLTSDDVSEVRKRLLSARVDIVGLGDEKSDGGIVQRTGARGRLRSVYCRDPDGNLIE
jgi:catechol 2,3-dioxygenase-like lactoylglutathione lyase family enzyme